LPALRQFAIERQLGFVGLTDHAEDFDEATFHRFVAECNDLSRYGPTLIPGLEFRFAGLKGLHLLALGLTRWIEPTTVDEFIAMTREAAALTIAAHPVLPNYTYPAVVLEGIDAIEVWNAAYNTRFLPDPRAIRLLRSIRRTRPGVVALAGLDQHDARNDRETRVEVFADSNPLAAIKAGRFRNRGRTMSFDAHADLSAGRTAALWGARLALDAAERLQDRAARWLSARKP
jgi:hypothetical protein